MPVAGAVVGIVGIAASAAGAKKQQDTLKKTSRQQAKAIDEQAEAQESAAYRQARQAENDQIYQQSLAVLAQLKENAAQVAAESAAEAAAGVSAAQMQVASVTKPVIRNNALLLASFTLAGGAVLALGLTAATRKDRR